MQCDVLPAFSLRLQQAAHGNPVRLAPFIAKQGDEKGKPAKLAQSVSATFRKAFLKHIQTGARTVRARSFERPSSAEVIAADGSSKGNVSSGLVHLQTEACTILKSPRRQP